MAESKSLTAALQPARDALRTRWQALAPRERQGLLLAAVLVGLALLWAVALAPALRTLKAAPARSAELAAVAERMQALQARARWLQAKPASAPGDSLKALQDATAALGRQATLQVLGEQATVSLRQLDAAALEPWLGADGSARPSPLEVHLQRDSGSTEPRWSGTLVYRLPAKP